MDLTFLSYIKYNKLRFFNYTIIIYNLCTKAVHFAWYKQGHSVCVYVSDVDLVTTVIPVARRIRINSTLYNIPLATMLYSIHSTNKTFACLIFTRLSSAMYCDGNEWGSVVEAVLDLLISKLTFNASWTALALGEFQTRVRRTGSG